MARALLVTAGDNAECLGLRPASLQCLARARSIHHRADRFTIDSTGVVTARPMRPFGAS